MFFDPLRAIIQHQVSETFALRRIHRDGGIELNHRRFLRGVPKFRALPVNASRNICIWEFDTSTEDISGMHNRGNRRVARTCAVTHLIFFHSPISEFFCHRKMIFNGGQCI
jgi:hypothetical protein